MGRCIYGPCGDCEYSEFLSGSSICLYYEEGLDTDEPRTMIDVDTGDIYVEDGHGGWKKIGNVDDDDWDDDDDDDDDYDDDDDDDWDDDDDD